VSFDFSASNDGSWVGEAYRGLHDHLRHFIFHPIKRFSLIGTACLKVILSESPKAASPLCRFLYVYISSDSVYEVSGLGVRVKVRVRVRLRLAEDGDHSRITIRQ